MAIALLLGGGLNALQGAAVSTGIPFTLVILVMCYCLWLAFKRERAKLSTGRPGSVVIQVPPRHIQGRFPMQCR